MSVPLDGPGILLAALQAGPQAPTAQPAQPAQRVEAQSAPSQSGLDEDMERALRDMQELADIVDKRVESPVGRAVMRGIFRQRLNINIPQQADIDEQRERQELFAKKNADRRRQQIVDFAPLQAVDLADQPLSDALQNVFGGISPDAQALIANDPGITLREALSGSQIQLDRGIIERPDQVQKLGGRLAALTGIGDYRISTADLVNSDIFGPSARKSPQELAADEQAQGVKAAELFKERMTQAEEGLLQPIMQSVFSGLEASTGADLEPGTIDRLFGEGFDEEGAAIVGVAMETAYKQLTEGLGVPGQRAAGSIFGFGDLASNVEDFLDGALTAEGTLVPQTQGQAELIRGLLSVSDQAGMLPQNTFRGLGLEVNPTSPVDLEALAGFTESVESGL